MHTIAHKYALIKNPVTSSQASANTHTKMTANILKVKQVNQQRRTDNVRTHLPLIPFSLQLLSHLSSPLRRFIYFFLSPTLSLSIFPTPALHSALSSPLSALLLLFPPLSSFLFSATVNLNSQQNQKLISHSLSAALISLGKKTPTHAHTWVAVIMLKAWLLHYFHTYQCHAPLQLHTPRCLSFPPLPQSKLPQVMSSL